MDDRAFCIGGPLDGQWRKIEGKILVAADTPRMSVLDFPRDIQSSAHVKLINYRLEKFSADGFTGREFLYFYIAEGIGTVMDAMKRLVERYQPDVGEGLPHGDNQ